MDFMHHDRGVPGQNSISSIFMAALLGTAVASRGRQKSTTTITNLRSAPTPTHGVELRKTHLCFFCIHQLGILLKCHPVYPCWHQQSSILHFSFICLYLGAVDGSRPVGGIGGLWYLVSQDAGSWRGPTAEDTYSRVLVLSVFVLSWLLDSLQCVHELRMMNLGLPAFGSALDRDEFGTQMDEDE